MEDLSGFCFCHPSFAGGFDCQVEASSGWKRLRERGSRSAQHCRKGIQREREREETDRTGPIVCDETSPGWESDDDRYINEHAGWIRNEMEVRCTPRSKLPTCKEGFTVPGTDPQMEKSSLMQPHATLPSWQAPFL